MKKLLFIASLIFPWLCASQIDGSLLLGLPHVSAAEVNTITNRVEGSLLYNSTEKKVMLYNGEGWVEPVVLPPDILDGDDDTTYFAGSGLDLNGSTFSVNQAALTPDWNNLVNIPSTLDLSPTNEIQILSKNGNQISLSNGGGSIVETETNLSQNTGNGIISYTGESGGITTAQVVSNDPNNSITVGSDGGAFLASPSTTTTVVVDQSYVWAGVVDDPDIHSNGTLEVDQTRSDAGWSFSGPSTLSYSGAPAYVTIDLMAVVNNTGSHYAAPHIRVFRNGQQIGEGGAYHLDNSAFYSGRMTTNLHMVDASPGTNPIYTFTTLEDDTRVMNNATITSLSPISLIAVEKISVAAAASN